VGTTTPVSDKARSHVGQVLVIGPDKVITVIPNVTSGKMDTQVTTTRKWMDGALAGTRSRARPSTRSVRGGRRLVVVGAKCSNTVDARARDSILR